MKSPSRYIVAMLLTGIYCLILLTPLAPLSLKSPRLAHAITGECSGDCNICGCSLERSATRTCCCWQKKLQHEQGQGENGEADCCKIAKKAKSGKTICTAPPCGSGKQFAFWSGEKLEQLPYRFSNCSMLVNEEILAPNRIGSLTSRSIPPPDPPPKISPTA